MSATVRWFSELGMGDIEEVGGKNASLGEMVSNLADLGVRVPDGFATTAAAYQSFIGDTGLAERITGLLEDLERNDLPPLLTDHLPQCVGLTTTVERLSRVRNERRPGSRYASSEQCRWELRRAGDLYAAHRVPVIDSSSRSVEEMATLIIQARTKNKKAKAAQ